MSTFSTSPDSPVINRKISTDLPLKTREWTNTQKFAFRVGFIYILLLCIPTYLAFYQHLFHLEFSKITYHDFQSVVAFWPPQIVLIESEEGVFGILNYINLILVFVIAIAGAVIWSLFDKKRPNYNNLYYWIRVLARYRLAYGMIGWGLKKPFRCKWCFLL